MTDSRDSLAVSLHVSQDEQLVYGFDWSHEPSLQCMYATCSFYDQHVRLWQMQAHPEP